MTAFCASYRDYGKIRVMDRSSWLSSYEFHISRPEFRIYESGKISNFIKYPWWD